MANILEKRIASRHSINGPITLHSSILTSRGIDAHLLNFSDQGICFATDTKLIPGTTILFEASDDCHLMAEKQADCELLSSRMVTVKWCHQNSRKGRTVYTVGANYMLPQ